MKRSDYVLRISVTSSCNLNCIYCNTQRVIDHREVMSDEDLLDTIKAGVEAGVKRIGWTGGEPTVKPRFIELVSQAKKMGIEKQSMTTNGILYYKMADKLKGVGITKINFSLDTLDAKEYKRICGFDGLSKVLSSIEKAVSLYEKIKINCVITKSNKKVMRDMIDYFDRYKGKVVIRFLEMVPCGQMYEHDKTIFEDEFLSIHEMMDDMKKIGELESVDIDGDVPKSLYFKIKGKSGIYGVNPNHSVGYKCDKEKCPKIRISPHGFISNCTINLDHVRDFRGKSLEQKINLMKEVIKEKQTRNYKGFIHKQKHYDFWRFGINPEYILKKFYKSK